MRCTWILLAMLCPLLLAQPKAPPPLPAARAIQVQGRATAVGERRTALVIGNAAYKTGPLANPVFDARDISESLRHCGFAVMKLENATRDQMAVAIRDFGDRLLEGGVGLFYYAGHGMQVRGRNYLIPVNADILREDEVPYQALDAEAVLAKMETARNRLNILILDACRNDPFGRSFRSGSQGLAQMDAPKGTFIAFATAPGRTAADGTGRNGLYTQHLLGNLQTPGLKLEDLFKRVRSGVLKDSADQQMPWDSSSLMGDFYFVPGAAPPAAAPSDATAMELAFWNSVKDSRNKADFEAYLSRFPAGTFAELARNRLDGLKPPGAELPSAPSQAYLGVSLQDLTEELKQTLGEPSGALVTNVADGSPAAKAALRPLDLITHADGAKLETAATLVDIVRGHKVGDSLGLRVVRDRQVLRVAVTLARKPLEPAVPDLPPTARSEDQPDPVTAFSGAKSVYGFFASELTTELRRRYGIGDEVKGVAVASVDPQGPAKDLLAVGDVVTALLLQGGRHDVTTLPQYLQAMGGLAQKPMVLLVHRAQLRQNVVLTIPYTPQKP